jgi:hypothetical protein
VGASSSVGLRVRARGSTSDSAAVRARKDAVRVFGGSLMQFLVTHVAGRVHDLAAVVVPLGEHAEMLRELIEHSQFVGRVRFLASK